MSFSDMMNINNIIKTHFSKRLTDSNDGFQLPNSDRNMLSLIFVFFDFFPILNIEILQSLGSRLI